MPKTRLDVALVEQGFAESREKAKAIIMSGIVFVNNQKSDKAGNTVKPDDVIEVRGKTLKYVSRGGLKLEKAMQVFPINLENTNFRYVTKEDVPDELDFASVDVSFISLYHIFPVMRTLLKDGGEAVCLIKPQFEAGKENVGKKGVVRDKNVHIAVVEKIIDLILENNYTLLGLDFSPIKGPEGNIEYLCHIKKTEKAENLCEITASEVVEKSYNALKEG